MGSPAFADTYSLGQLPTDGSFYLTGPTLPASGGFDDEYAFTLTTSGNIYASVTVAGPTDSQPTGSWRLYEVGSAAPLASDPLVVSSNGGSVGATFAPVLGSASASYYVEISGTSNGALSVGGSVSTFTASAVPELSTWAMLGLGFAGLGLVGGRKRRDACIAI